MMHDCVDSEWNEGEEDVEGEEVHMLGVSVESCLILNSVYQEALNEFAEYLRSKLRENQSRQNDLKSTQNEDILGVANISTHSHPNSLIVFMAPYFKDKKSLRAPDNEDTIIKKRNGEINQAFLYSSKPWSHADKNTLISVVHNEMMAKKMLPLMNQREKLTKNKANINKPDVKAKLKKLDAETNKIKSLPKEQLNGERHEDLDWLRIAAQLDDSHDDNDCEIFWRNWLHPDVNKKPWTREEDAKLESLVAKCGTHNWDQVAELLGTGRVAWQCCARYQSELNKDLRRTGPLTKAEAETVEKIIDYCRVGDYIPWHQVGYFVEGRSLPQIKHYWNKINVPKRGDNWSEEENKVLTAAVKKYGTHNWRKVAYYLPGRSNRQCRERYMMRLNFDERRLGSWTQQEDQLILELAPKYDFRWVKLEKDIKGRNARQIASRYELLNKWQKTGKRGKMRKKPGTNNVSSTTRTLSVKTQLYDRIKATINRMNAKESNEDLDEILRTGREKLLKRLNQELSGSKDLSVRGRPKKSLTEDNIDMKIIEKFAHYDHKPMPQKGINRGVQDQCVYDNLKLVLKELLTGVSSTSNTDLSQVIRAAIAKHVSTSEVNQDNVHHKSCTTSETHGMPQVIFPPNRCTVKGLEGILLQSDYLSRKVASAKRSIDSKNTSFTDEEEYRILSSRFRSAFCWPALLSLIDPPSLKPQLKSQAPRPKSERKSWLSTDSTRMVQIRTKQTQLIQSAIRAKEDVSQNATKKSDVIDVNSTETPWFLEATKERNYNLKSLKRNSFAYTRNKNRREAVVEEEDNSSPDAHKSSHIENNNNQMESTSTRASRKRKAINDANSEEAETKASSSSSSSVMSLNVVKRKRGRPRKN